MGDSPISLDTILKSVEILAVIGSAAAVFYKLGRTTERFEMIGEQQAKEISTLQASVEKFGAVIVDIALQKQRLDSQAERLNILDRRVEDLRRGEGLITATARN